jgi:hypothetical protein
MELAILIVRENYFTQTEMNVFFINRIKNGMKCLIVQAMRKIFRIKTNFHLKRI